MSGLSEFFPNGVAEEEDVKLLESRIRALQQLISIQDEVIRESKTASDKDLLPALLDRYKHSRFLKITFDESSSYVQMETSCVCADCSTEIRRDSRE